MSVNIVIFLFMLHYQHILSIYICYIYIMGVVDMNYKQMSG